MESPASAQKLVVLGIPYSLETEDLRQYMSKFGAIDDVMVLGEKGTKRSRGFGFVTFRDQAVADAVLGMKHILGGRELDIKVAIPKEAMSSPSPARGAVPSNAPGKALATRLFVAKIPSTVTDDNFRRFFEQFGTVVDAYMPSNAQTGKHRGIGFVTYADAASVDIAMSEPREMDGVELAVDRATPKVHQGPKAPPGMGAMGSFQGMASRDTVGGMMMRGVGGSEGMRRPPASDWGVYYDPASERDREREREGHGQGQGQGLGLGLDVPPTPPLASRFLASPSGGHYSPMYAAPMLGAPREPASPGMGMPYAHARLGSKPVHPTKIFVGKLTASIGAEDLKEYFSRYGPIRDVYVPRDAAKSGHRGFGFVTFEEEEVAAFVAKRQHTINGVQVATDRASPPEAMGGGAKGGEASNLSSVQSVPGAGSQRPYSPPRESAYPGALVGYASHYGVAPRHSTPALQQEQFHVQLASYYGASPAQLAAGTSQDWINAGYMQQAGATRSSSLRDVRYRPY